MNQEVIEFKPERYGISPKKHRLEKKFQSSYLLVYFDKKNKFFYEAVDLRIYGTPARNTACVWISANNKYATGSGDATGYGYHRPSEAVSKALKTAGIIL